MTDAKFERKIVARGLTASNIGSTIVANGHHFKVESVAYDQPLGLVKINDYIILPNMEEISIID